MKKLLLILKILYGAFIMLVFGLLFILAFLYTMIKDVLNEY